MSIIIRPVISEKANIESEMNSRYTFYVKPTVNKRQVKVEVEKRFGVNVVSVKTMIVPPTVKTKHTKKGLQVGKTNKLKKAIVQVKEGQTIDIYSNI